MRLCHQKAAKKRRKRAARQRKRMAKANRALEFEGSKTGPVGDVVAVDVAWDSKRGPSTPAAAGAQGGLGGILSEQRRAKADSKVQVKAKSETRDVPKPQKKKSIWGWSNRTKVAPADDNVAGVELQQLEAVDTKQQAPTGKAAALSAALAAPVMPTSLVNVTQQMMLEEFDGSYSDSSEDEHGPTDVRYAEHCARCHAEGRVPEQREMYHAVVAVQTKWRSIVSKRKFNETKKTMAMMSGSGAGKATTLKLLNAINDIEFDSDGSGDGDEDPETLRALEKEAEEARAAVYDRVQGVMERKATKIQSLWRVKARQRIYAKNRGATAIQKLLRGGWARRRVLRIREIKLWRRTVCLCRNTELFFVYVIFGILMACALWIDHVFGSKFGPEQTEAFVNSVVAMVLLKTLIFLPTQIIGIHILGNGRYVVGVLFLLIVYGGLQALAIFAYADGEWTRSMLPFTACGVGRCSPNPTHSFSQAAPRSTGEILSDFVPDDFHYMDLYRLCVQMALQWAGDVVRWGQGVVS